MTSQFRRAGAAIRAVVARMWISGIGLAALITPENALAHGSIPQDVPVDRLVSNLTKYIEAHPGDAEGYYRLGRVHTLALETGTEFVRAYSLADPARPAEGSWARRNLGQEQKPVVAKPEQLRAHLAEAIRNLNQAIERRPTDARYRLTLACALETGESMMHDVDPWPLCPVKGALEPRADVDQSDIDAYRDKFESAPGNPVVVDRLMDQVRSDHRRGTSRDIIMTLAYEHRERPEYNVVVQKLRAFDWHEQIEEQFFTALCYALPQNAKATEKPIWGDLDDWVSYEAGSDFIRVVERRDSRPTDAIRLKVAKQAIKAFNDLPKPSAITPIVIDFKGRHLAELESPTTIEFDLDGSHRPQRQTWVKPDVGILAWDPEHTGRITSGRQLFGSVSWWLLFDNGYDALDLLDDNRDGELAGAELNGIVVWFDRNGNGISDAGEVMSVRELGIVAISCRATGREGTSPVNMNGARLADGRVVPTFDWLVLSKAYR